ncbi:MAG: hemolysin family protein [Pseudomonadota bacterium]
MDASDSPPSSATADTADAGTRRGPDGPRASKHPSPPADPADPEPSSSGSLFSGLLTRLLGGGKAEEAHGEGADPLQRDKATPAERVMIGNIMRLRELRISDVMTPRADIEAISDEASLDEAMAAFERGGFSRLPVFHETLDDPVGFIHLKDLALRYGVGCQRNGADFKPADHLHQALFVPPSMRIAALLQRMQGARVHMALVIDEFGGVDGLVTIEDLVEQIVGDIEDEHDQDESEQWREAAPGVYTVDARADIGDFEEATKIILRPDDWEEDADTLGGLVFMLSGRVPARGEVISHPHGHEFLITDADPRRIKKLRLTLNGATNRPASREAAE